jgi:nucleoside-diphosphate-sugar epimerase
MSSKVLVTGGSGFVASHLIEQVLSRGDEVNTTVRSLTSHRKIAPLQALQQRHPGRLHLFEADLLKAGSFDRAMRDCSMVYHVASPFILPEKIKDGRRQVLEPALEGTRHVLASVQRTGSVTRVVLTSTIGAIFGDYADVLNMRDQTLSEEYFNTSSTVDYNPYHYAKVMAEQEAWNIARAQTRWSLVSINPGLVLGPSLTPASESGSLFLLDEMLRGKFAFGMPDMSVAVVDVRDVAAAHIEAATRPEASGRYILAQEQMVSFLDMAGMLREVHRRPYLLPRRPIPAWLIKVVGPLFGVSGRYLRNHIGIRFRVDNHRSREQLGVVYRPVRDTLQDHYASWRKQRDGAAA